MRLLKNATGLFLLLTIVIACIAEVNNLDNIEPYSGPWLTSYNTSTRYSDSAIVRVIVDASTHLQFENGDSQYPDGVLLTFYDIEGMEINTVQANRGYFFKKDNLYTAEGNVVVNNLEKKQTLSTEQLHWLPNERRIFTDRFVIIETEDEILQGNGLEAPEDFSTYKILQPTGIFTIRDKK